MQIVVNYAYISMRFVLVPTMKRSKTIEGFRKWRFMATGVYENARARFLSTVGGKNFQKGLEILTTLA